jgi:hypothetical protein
MNATKIRNRFQVLVLATLAFATGGTCPAVADMGTANTDDSYYELGVVAGLPALVNGVVGYRNGPAVFRFSGGYYGSSSFYGIQGECAWAFYRKPDLKQYVGVIGAQIAGSRHNGLTKATMLGIMYGVHWNGLSLEAGPETLIGPFDTAHGAKGGVTFQAGYTILIPSL